MLYRLFGTIPLASERVYHGLSPVRWSLATPMDFSPLSELPRLVLSLWYFPYVYFFIYVYARAVSSSPLGRCPDFPLEKSSMRLLSVRAAVLYDFIEIFKNDFCLFISGFFSILWSIYFSLWSIGLLVSMKHDVEHGHDPL